MDKDVRRRLMKEDEREERELRGYVAQSLTADMISSLPGSAQSQESKSHAQVEQESQAWANQQDSR
jgi:peptide-N4-(N-acetyl-beta-glucosaminyl)asparagine amidase